MKGHITFQRYGDYTYHHLSIRVSKNANPYHGPRCDITWQSSRDENDAWRWYAMTCEVNAQRPADISWAAKVAKTLTDQAEESDYPGTFLSDPADVLAALQKAGYVIVREGEKYGQFLQPGSYYKARIPDWGTVWTTNGKSEIKARSAILEQLHNHQYATAWGAAGYPMEYVTIEEPDLTALLDPEKLLCVSL